ncbi:hypothetical protein R3X27_06435 [Tropicimonas sp. TH_r6]|uniref:hypothetical protein n=1 Tax=Tropicimonas sp. TH_r6 TaxID=3082085 RepID=UPI002953E3F1|nr:hypothetical protein [Tropicimonas sp. TH_r6]MDV7142314.1 hypothetical protein [Tropicimonas sp. TH_r6]
MVVGLVLVSTAVAMSCAGAMLFLGGGWLSVLGIYMASGMVTAIMFLLRLILIEMHQVDASSGAAEELPANSAGRPAKTV